MHSRYEQKESLFETRELLQFSLLCVCMFCFWLIGRSVLPGAPSTPTIVTETTIRIPPNPFDTVRISAQAAAVYSIKEKRFIYTKNSDVPLALASITKLMTALVAAETGNPEDTVVIPATALLTEGDSGLHVGERWRLADLIDYMMIVSSNDGASALALSIGARPQPEQGDGLPTPYPDPAARFITRMNQASDRLGLRNTHFNNESGLDTSTEQGGSYGSARDVALLMAYALEYHPAILKKTTLQETTIHSEHFTHQARNTNPFVVSIPGIKGSKTGFTDLAGGNLVIAFDAGIDEPFVAVALGSTPEDRFSDITTLASTTRAWLAITNTF